MWQSSPTPLAELWVNRPRLINLDYHSSELADLILPYLVQSIYLSLIGFRAAAIIFFGSGDGRLVSPLIEHQPDHTFG